MAIENRTRDSSLQKTVLGFNQNVALSTGETGVLSYIPFNCIINAAQIAAFSVEANPNLMFTVNRFIPGTGFTNITVGSTFAPNSFGTSGVLAGGVSLPAVGSTLLTLMANDVLGYVVGGGATAAIFGLSGCFIVQPLQDVMTFLNGLA